MKFVLILPQQQIMETVDCADMSEALHRASLTVGEVDFGSLTRRIGYVVHQFGLFMPPAEQSYSAIGDTLIAGPCVLFGVDEGGETIDLLAVEAPEPRFFAGVNEVEAAIRIGQIRRPTMAVNGQVIWQWPQPAPAGIIN